MTEKYRELIGKEKDFYVIIYNIIEKYDYLMIDRKKRDFALFHIIPLKITPSDQTKKINIFNKNLV